MAAMVHAVKKVHQTPTNDASSEKYSSPLTFASFVTTATCSAPGLASVVGFAIRALLSNNMVLDVRGFSTIIAKDPNHLI